MKKFNITVNGNSYEVEIEEVQGSTAAAAPAPKAAPAPVAAAPAPKAAPAPAAAPAAAVPAGGASIDAPMPGKITKVVATVGQAVNAGDVLLILEAMKMQNEITATSAGTVKAISVQVGQSVKTGDQMVVIG